MTVEQGGQFTSAGVTVDPGGSVKVSDSGTNMTLQTMTVTSSSDAQSTLTLNNGNLTVAQSLSLLSAPLDMSGGGLTANSLILDPAPGQTSSISGAGFVTVGQSGAVGCCQTTIGGGGNLTVSDSSILNLRGGVLFSGGNDNFSGVSTVQVTGDVQINGGVAPATVVLSHAALDPSGVVSIGAGGTLDVEEQGAVFVAGAQMTDAGLLTINSSGSVNDLQRLDVPGGTVQLLGGSSFTVGAKVVATGGTLDVRGGAMQIGPTGASLAGQGTVVVSATAVLFGSGTILGSLIGEANSSIVVSAPSQGPAPQVQAFSAMAAPQALAFFSRGGPGGACRIGRQWRPRRAT